MQITLNKTPYYVYTANQDFVANQDTIVFVHGAAMDHSVWSHQSRYFAYHGYNVVAVDLPGHNLSDGKLLDSIADLSDWLIQVIKQVVGKNAGNVHLVGHSMGALIALQSAAILSESATTSGALKSVTLLGFSYPMAVTPQLLDAAKNDPPTAYAMMTQWSHASKIGGEPLPGFWLPGMQMSMLENSKSGAVFADLTACNQYADGEQAFEKLKTSCPILFLCGKLDRMAPAKLAAKFASADNNDNIQITFIPHCGHNLMSESPDSVLHELQQFIGKHRAA